MSDLFWLSEAQMARLRPYFPKSHGKPRVDDRRVLSGIIFVNRNGLRWRDVPAEYGRPKTLYNRWIRWSRKGIFAHILMELARAYVAQGNQEEARRTFTQIVDEHPTSPYSAEARAELDAPQG